MTNAANAPIPLSVHATAVAIDGLGVLIDGASGAGKSTLALQLIALGATLISDDLVLIKPGPEDWPILHHPGPYPGVIEARGVGLVNVPHQPQAPLSLIVDLDRTETTRLPKRRQKTVLGHDIDALSRVDSPAFASTIALVAKGGHAI